MKKSNREHIIRHLLFWGVMILFFGCSPGTVNQADPASRTKKDTGSLGSETESFAIPPIDEAASAFETASFGLG